jgi:hypothetical protein
MFGERHIARCAYLLSDVDYSGLKTPKVAQAALAKAILLSKNHEITILVQ